MPSRRTRLLRARLRGRPLDVPDYLDLIERFGSGTLSSRSMRCCQSAWPREGFCCCQLGSYPLTRLDTDPFAALLLASWLRLPRVAGRGRRGIDTSFIFCLPAVSLFAL